MISRQTERSNKQDARRLARWEHGGMVGILLALLVVVGILVGLVFFVFGKIVPPDKIGVRQNYFNFFGLEKGFTEVGLKPGLHPRFPYISDIILLPRGIQFVHFNNRPQYGDYDQAELDIPTSDGSKVKADITLIVRLNDEPSSEQRGSPQNLERQLKEDVVPFVEYIDRPHGGPRDLVHTWKGDQLTQLRKFSEIAVDELRQHFGKLSTTDFYNPVSREGGALRAHYAINDLIAPHGMELWGTLVRRYIYAEKNIDDQIFAKNLQDQTERLNAAASDLAEAKAETERQRALWDAKIKDLKVEGGAKVLVMESEADLYEATKEAEGNLSIATAKAEIDAAKASALSELAGSEVYIARELAPLLSSLKGGIITDLDPYDIKEWVRKLTEKGTPQQ